MHATGIHMKFYLLAYFVALPSPTGACRLMLGPLPDLICTYSHSYSLGFVCGIVKKASSDVFDCSKSHAITFYYCIILNMYIRAQPVFMSVWPAKSAHRVLHLVDFISSILPFMIISILITTTNLSLIDFLA